MKRYGMVIDVDKCVGCYNCTLACRDEHAGNDHLPVSAAQPATGGSWVKLQVLERGSFPKVKVSHTPMLCLHCAQAPCVQAGEGAVYRRPDGIVIIDPVKAKGQRHLVDSCPYGAIYWNEEKQLPQAWPFDAHLLDQGWKKTRGSQVCPTHAMRTLQVEDEEMQRIVKEEGLEVLHPEYGTRPRVYYKSLQRFYKVFVGGTLAGDIDGVTECVEAARVVLEQDGKAVAEARSDAYGDFRFGGLKENSGAYRVQVSDARFAARSIEFELYQSTYLGTIVLDLPGVRFRNTQ